MIGFSGLRTSRLTLRLPEHCDEPALVELAGDFRIFDTTANIPHPYTADDAAAFVARAHTAFDQQTALHLVVTADEVLVGYVMLRFEADLNSAELGYWIGAPFWNRGFATEASRATIDYAFGTLAQQRLSACFLARNPESGRVLEKLGFVREGVQRGHSFKYGYGEDLVLAGLLRSEWLKASAG